MPTRETESSYLFDRMLKDPLLRGGYRVDKPKVPVGTRPQGGDYNVDRIVASPDGKLYLVSLRWQRVKGTTEQKIPYEAICLAHVLDEARGKYVKAYIVLGGTGWTMKEFYTSGGLDKPLKGAEKVKIVDVDTFNSMATRTEL
jgi:hypothetical protein